MIRALGLLATSGLLLVVVLLTQVLASAGANAAVSISNRDEKEHKLTVIEDDGKTKTDHKLKGGGLLEGVCKADAAAGPKSPP